MMEPGDFYRALAGALTESGFRFREEDLTEEDVASDENPVAASVRAATKFAPSVIQALTGGALPGGAFGVHSVFDSEALQERLEPIRRDASMVGFKYVLSQPVVFAMVEADTLASDQAIAMSRRFDEAVIAMRDLTATVGGFQIGGWHLGGTKGSVTALLLFTFFNSQTATKFRESTQPQCKILRYWKKTMVLPWVADVAQRKLVRHPGMPVLPGVIAKREFERDLFG